MLNAEVGNALLSFGRNVIAEKGLSLILYVIVIREDFFLNVYIYICI